MGKYSFANTRPPEPAKVGTEFSETNRFGQDSPLAEIAHSGAAQLQLGRGSTNRIRIGKKDWTDANFLELAGALIVLSLVAHIDANNGGKGMMNPLTLLLFCVAFLTFVVREW